MERTYIDMVEAVEANLRPYAKRSFESFSPTFVDGGDRVRFFNDEIKTESGRRRIMNRTPIQLERDRILYSLQMRRLSERYHVLFRGHRRIIRNYVTHTMRMAQVSRAIATRLGLNPDFAEAIALGAKVGAPPFVHASKHVLSLWIREKISSIDTTRRRERGEQALGEQRRLAFPTTGVPPWIQDLKTADTFAAVQCFIPWASGTRDEDAYSSGQSGYWQLCTNPLAIVSAAKTYSPETMYGIWRHSRNNVPTRDSFAHRMEFDGTETAHAFDWSHATYEGLVVQFADDIAWIIENLNDANAVMRLTEKASLYDKLEVDLARRIPEPAQAAIHEEDPGRLYAYFVSDFIDTSESRLTENADAARTRQCLRDGNASECLIGLSDEANAFLDSLQAYLGRYVFDELRVRHRKSMLETFTRASLDLLLDDERGFLEGYIEDQALTSRWTTEEVKRAKDLLNNPVHKVYLSATVFASMSDQEIHEFVGIHAI